MCVASGARGSFLTLLRLQPINSHPEASSTFLCHPGLLLYLPHLQFPSTEPERKVELQLPFRPKRHDFASVPVKFLPRHPRQNMFQSMRIISPINFTLLSQDRVGIVVFLVSGRKCQPSRHIIPGEPFPNWLLLEHLLTSFELPYLSFPPSLRSSPPRWSFPHCRLNSDPHRCPPQHR